MLVNGSARSEFMMERGLRQGCPLSPLLFNLVAETLLILVNQFDNNHWLHGVRVVGLNKSTTVL